MIPLASGFAQLHKFVSQETFDELAQLVNVMYARFDSGDPLPNEDLKLWYAAWRGLRVQELREYFYLEMLIGEITSLFEAQVGGRWNLMDDYSFFRRAEPNLPPTWSTWHCDAEGASTVNLHTQCYTLWLPLAAVGVDKPSLEIIVGSNATIINETIEAGRGRSDEYVATVSGEHVMPTMAERDALIFDQHTLHRTQQMDFNSPRVSAELRFVPA